MRFLTKGLQNACVNESFKCKKNRFVCKKRLMGGAESKKKTIKLLFKYHYCFQNLNVIFRSKNVNNGKNQNVLSQNACLR